MSQPDDSGRPDGGPYLATAVGCPFSVMAAGGPCPTATCRATCSSNWTTVHGSCRVEDDARSLEDARGSIRQGWRVAHCLIWQSCRAAVAVYFLLPIVLMKRVGRKIFFLFGGGRLKEGKCWRLGQRGREFFSCRGLCARPPLILFSDRWWDGFNVSSTHRATLLLKTITDPSSVAHFY
jgi:hypothetical protein